MGSNKWRTALRRCLTVIAGVTALTVVGASAALAFDSPGKPPGLGAQTITWAGQGADGGVLKNSQCDAAHDPFGKDQPYLLWILNMKGTVTTGPTTPALTLGGSGSGTYYQSAPFTSNNVHIVTSYFTPDSNLTASAAMNVTDIGTGQWQLVISHGCAGTNNPPPPPPPAALPLTATKTANGTYDTTYRWTIAKAADKTQINSADGNATFHYTVTVGHDGGTPSNWKVSGIIDVANPNSADAVVTDVTDTLSDGTPCTVDMGNGLTVPANGDTTYPYSCSLSGQPADPLNNTAKVSWDDQPVAGTSGLAGGSADAAVTGIAFSQDQVFNGQVTVSDPNADPTTLGTASASDTNPITFGYDHTFSGDPAGTCTSHDNTATIDETGQKTNKVTVTQCVGKNLTVSKTASPSFDRTYVWDIHKAVDKTKVNQVGGNATFKYTVSVHHDNGTDGSWQVKGNIHVANPNDWEPITANVTDAIDNGGTCTVGNGSPGNVDPASAVIPASGSVDFPYTCSYSSAPKPAVGTNTATVNWSASDAATPGGSASGPANADFGSASPTIKDDQVAVNDTQGGPLGTVKVGDDNPKLFPYSKTFPVPANGCLTYPNTATFTTNTTGTTGQASQSVQVCGPAKTGALTMGYWQNKNGQGIIKASTGTALSDYLRGYAPFGDLTADSSSAQVAAYFISVFNAANASGTGTSMLKAQMLATALDVYFWHQIGAPANIGDVTIDTSAWSTAFKGATSMKVNEMLSYETGSVFGNGSTTWYGGNKTLVTTAIAAFNAINNQIAFGA